MSPLFVNGSSVLDHSAAIDCLQDVLSSEGMLQSLNASLAEASELNRMEALDLVVNDVRIDACDTSEDGRLRWLEVELSNTLSNLQRTSSVAVRS
jgi:hypothetical protein